MENKGGEWIPGWKNGIDGDWWITSKMKGHETWWCPSEEVRKGMGSNPLVNI